jgi:hypothetical protein
VMNSLLEEDPALDPNSQICLAIGIEPIELRQNLRSPVEGSFVVFDRYRDAF